MKKAWVYGLAAMLGLGVSTMIANQASTFAASAPPIAEQTSASSCGSSQPKDDRATGQNAVANTTDDQPPVISMVDTGETTGSKENPESSVIASSSQEDKKSSISTEASSSVSASSSEATEISANEPSKTMEKTVSSTPTIKTEQEANPQVSQVSTKQTAKEQKEQAVVAAAQAATHDAVKVGRAMPMVSGGINHFTTSTVTQKYPRNAVELIWQALIDTFTQRHQCPAGFSDQLVVNIPSTNRSIVETSLVFLTRKFNKTLSSAQLASKFQKDILKPADRTTRDIIGLLNQILLKHLISTGYR